MATMRVGLHALVAALGVVPVIGAWDDAGVASWGVSVAVVVVWAVYATGGWALSAGRTPWWWLALLGAWGVLLWMSPDGAYLAFPFALLAGATAGVTAMWGIAAVLGAASIIALGAANGWSLAGVVGPAIGVGVAVLVGRAYRMLAAAVVEREELVAEVLQARQQAEAEARRAGVLEERARLSRELHDTVSQALSSIQMLVHAARRVDDVTLQERHLQSVQETAAESLAETRQLIAALAPAGLDQGGLAPALRRLGSRLAETTGASVTVTAHDDSMLTVDAESALLRIAQGACANVEQHSGASTVTIDLRRQGATVVLRVTDDGIGFDAPSGHRDLNADGSFGLRAMQERASQLGGRVDVVSEPGEGTSVTAQWEAGT